MDKDRIFSDVKSAAESVVKKSGDLIEITRVKVAAAAARAQLSEAYGRLGEAVFRQRDALNLNEGVRAVLTEIEAKIQEIDELEEKHSELKNLKNCKGCKKKNPREAVFCLYCGGKFSEEEAERDGETEPPEDAETARNAE
jgi:DNA repair ATPase RecN